LFFEAPKLNQPRSFRLKSTGMAEQSNFGGGSGGGGGGGSDYNFEPNQYVQNETFEQQSARNQQLNDFLTGLAKMSPTGLLMSSLNTLFGSQAPAPVEDVRTYFGVNPVNDFGYGSPADADPGAGGYGGSVGVDYGGPADGGYGGSPADADSGPGGYGGDGIGFAQGGLVDRVGGFNPAGPDDGAGYLQLGEYVIKKSAVDKYGQGLLDMINEGKIPTSAIPAGRTVLAKTWDAVSAQKAKMLEDIGVDPNGNHPAV
jgi:hypothetical protein